MNCSHCGSHNPTGRNFCGDCGGDARHTVRGRGGPTALRRDGRDGAGGTGRPGAGIERRVHRGNFQHEPDLTALHAISVSSTFRRVRKPTSSKKLATGAMSFPTLIGPTAVFRERCVFRFSRFFRMRSAPTSP